MAPASTVTFTFDEDGMPESPGPLMIGGASETPYGIAVVPAMYLVHTDEHHDDGDGEGGDGDEDGESAAHGISPAADWRPIVGVLDSDFSPLGNMAAASMYLYLGRK